MTRILPLDAVAAREREQALVDLLIDAVDSGASVGFLPPLAPAEAADYWREVFVALETSNRILLVAEDDARQIAGAVQLDLATRANALHRAEVMKLFVHRVYRRRGIARDLMSELEIAAREHGRTLLVLATREGDPSEQLYLGLGYIRAGAIPRYARSAGGELHTTVFLYKELT